MKGPYNMAFDPNKYSQLQAIDTNLAAQYLAAETQAPAAPAALSFQAPPAAAYAPVTAQQPQAPQPELARGTLEDFYNQPTSGNGGKGASSYFGSLIKGNKKPQGTWLQFRVDRDINGTDVSQLTDTNQVPQVWKFGPQAGKPKFQLTIPGTVLSSSGGDHGQFFESGTLRLYLKPGPVTDAFRAALQAGGETSGFPKGGSTIVMISAGEKPNKGNYSPTQLYDFRYSAPEAVSDTPAPVSAPPVSAPPVSAPPVSAPPVDVDSEKAALLAKLQGLSS